MRLFPVVIERISFIPALALYRKALDMITIAPPPFRPSEPFVSRLLFLDMEATGLSALSVPTEFGVCGLDLVPHSFLIRPRPEWATAERSLMAEIMTGISDEMLALEGVDPDEAGEMIDALLRERTVVSDNPESDAMWLTRLKPLWMHDGLRSTKEFEVQACYDLSRSLGAESFELLLRKTRRIYPHVHRAGPDALRMAACFRLLIDEDFRDFIGNLP